MYRKRQTNVENLCANAQANYLVQATSIQYRLLLMGLSFQFITLIACIDFEACLVVANMNTSNPNQLNKFLPTIQYMTNL